MLDNTLEDAARFVQAATREYQVKHMLPIARPLLDLVEIAPVGMGGIVGFFVGPITHSGMGDFGRPFTREPRRKVWVASSDGPAQRETARICHRFAPQGSSLPIGRSTLNFSVCGEPSPAAYSHSTVILYEQSGVLRSALF